MERVSFVTACPVSPFQQLRLGAWSAACTAGTGTPACDTWASRTYPVGLFWETGG